MQEVCYELDLFKKDVEKLWDFLFQPVTFVIKEEVLALKPNEDEIIEKATAFANNAEGLSEIEKESESFFNREFELLRQDIEGAWDFLFQPVQIFKK